MKEIALSTSCKDFLEELVSRIQDKGCNLDINNNHLLFSGRGKGGYGVRVEYDLVLPEKDFTDYELASYIELIIGNLFEDYNIDKEFAAAYDSERDSATELFDYFNQVDEVHGVWYHVVDGIWSRCSSNQYEFEDYSLE